MVLLLSDNLYMKYIFDGIIEDRIIISLFHFRGLYGLKIYCVETFRINNIVNCFFTDDYMVYDMFVS